MFTSWLCLKYDPQSPIYSHLYSEFWEYNTFAHFETEALWSFRVVVALYTKEATGETLSCGSWLYVGCYSLGWGYNFAKWILFIFLLHSYKCSGWTGDVNTGRWQEVLSILLLWFSNSHLVYLVTVIKKWMSFSLWVPY